MGDYVLEYDVQYEADFGLLVKKCVHNIFLHIKGQYDIIAPCWREDFHCPEIIF